MSGTPRRLRVKVRVSGDRRRAADASSGIWPNANWYEREVYDLFGVVFAGHPDLRRILMPEDWEGFPARKDYPVQVKVPVTFDIADPGHRGRIRAQHRVAPGARGRRRARDEGPAGRVSAGMGSTMTAPDAPVGSPLGPGRPRWPPARAARPCGAPSPTPSASSAASTRSPIASPRPPPSAGRRSPRIGACWCSATADRRRGAALRRRAVRPLRPRAPGPAGAGADHRHQRAHRGRQRLRLRSRVRPPGRGVRPARRRRRRHLHLRPLAQRRRRPAHGAGPRPDDDCRRRRRRPPTWRRTPISSSPSPGRPRPASRKGT